MTAQGTALGTDPANEWRAPTGRKNYDALAGLDAT